jgi:hypothetical protein
MVDKPSHFSSSERFSAQQAQTHNPIQSSSKISVWGLGLGKHREKLREDWIKNPNSRILVLGKKQYEIILNSKY